MLPFVKSLLESIYQVGQLVTLRSVVKAPAPISGLCGIVSASREKCGMGVVFSGSVMSFVIIICSFWYLNPSFKSVKYFAFPRQWFPSMYGWNLNKASVIGHIFLLREREVLIVDTSFTLFKQRLNIYHFGGSEPKALDTSLTLSLSGHKRLYYHLWNPIRFISISIYCKF